MIITRTPFRMSFAGGGSDIASFYEKHGGCVLSATINKYMYISIHPSFEKIETVLKYSQTEIVSDIDSIDHKYFKEVLEMEDFIFSSVVLKDVRKYAVDTKAGYFYVEHANASTQRKDYASISRNLEDMKNAFEFVEVFLNKCEEGELRIFKFDFEEWRKRYGRYWKRNIKNSDISEGEKQELMIRLEEIVGVGIEDVREDDEIYYKNVDWERRYIES